MKLYKPYSGSEGFDFMDRFCDQCWYDKEEKCPILAMTLAWDTDHTYYPNQWRYENDEPICVAFTKEKDHA